MKGLCLAKTVLFYCDLQNNNNNNSNHCNNNTTVTIKMMSAN